MVSTSLYNLWSGPHDDSKIYDDLFEDVVKHLGRWGAGSVYGFKGDQGIMFSVSRKNKNLRKLGLTEDPWIIISYNRRYDNLTIILSEDGHDDEDNLEYAIDYKKYVYAGEEPDVIDELLGI